MHCSIVQLSRVRMLYITNERPSTGVQLHNHCCCVIPALLQLIVCTACRNEACERRQKCGSTAISKSNDHKEMKVQLSGCSCCHRAAYKNGLGCGEQLKASCTRKQLYSDIEKQTVWVSHTVLHECAASSHADTEHVV